jgi:uncharacterized protein
MSTPYWPWWLGGAGLAAVAILFPLLNKAPLGVSGAFSDLFDWRGGSGLPPEAGTTDSCGGLPPEEPVSRSERIGSLIFLLSIALGGAVAGRIHGVSWGQTTLSPEFHRLFGHGMSAIAVLFFGGLLVGVGTRWSGGCTSGHGLSGCGRLQPASLVATAVFFGIAIATSFLVERILS